MPRRANILVAQTTGLVQFSGGGTSYLVQTPAGVLYFFYVDTGSDLYYKKSFNAGITWDNPVAVSTGTIVSFSIWFDKWSGLSGGLIHIATNDSGTDDTNYYTINTESSDAITGTVIQNTLVSSVAGGSVSITRTRGGNVLCYNCIDAGAEGGFYRLPNANVPNGAWDAAKTLPEALAVNDKMIMLPGFAADDQDAIGIFWDNSANEISRYLYHDSENTWSKSSIAASMTGQAVTTAFPHFAATVDLANSRVLLVAWSAVDTSNADLRCWTITESAITEVTNVVLNSTDDQGLAAICIDLQTGYWIAFYVGKSDGSENFLTSVNVYCKVSQDSGTTWGAETKLTTTAYDITWLITIPRLYLGQTVVAFHNDIALDVLMVNVDIMQPRTSNNLGI